MSGRSKMSCRDLVRLVTDYLDGALPPAERQRFDEHLAKCDGCATHLEQMRKTIATVGRLREDDIAPPVREALLRSFRDWKAQPT